MVLPCMWRRLKRTSLVFRVNSAWRRRSSWPGAATSSRPRPRALGENRQPVVAGGGDGTVNAVAGALVGTNTALGVLPIGTLNHFAKDLGVPLGLEAAVRNVFTGQVTKVDVGE